MRLIMRRFPCAVRQPQRMREPAIGLRCDETTRETIERIVVGIDALSTVLYRERARADFYEQALKWALGEGPSPRDVEAQDAALAYLYAASLDGYAVMHPLLDRIVPLLVMPWRHCSADTWREPTMAWSEAVGRLEVAWAMRRAWRHVHAAQRRIVEGDAVAAVGALRKAMAAIGAGLDRQSEIRAQSSVWAA